MICVSHASRAEVCWMYEVPEWKTRVVYNGVSPHRFDLDIDVGKARQRYEIGPMDPTVLFCGRLEWQKGPDILAEAVPGLLRHYYNAKFVFVGDGSMRAGIESRASQHGVAHAMRFLGHRSGDELIGLFKLSDGLCVPSRNEPFGIVVLEAWSAGKSAVVTQCGGPNEYVDHERTGLKVAPNADSIGWGLGTLLSDFDRARWMGANGRRRVEEDFTWDVIASQMLDAYGWPTLREARACAEDTADKAGTGRPQGRGMPPRLGAKLRRRVLAAGKISWLDPVDRGLDNAYRYKTEINEIQYRWVFYNISWT